MNFPQNLKYTSEHEWIRVEGDIAYVGITDYAQEQLGDIVFVDIPTVGETLEANEVFGSIEVVKTVSRSEEHTSELQSRQYLVCRLLLEKKNTYNPRHNLTTLYDQLSARVISDPTDGRRVYRLSHRNSTLLNSTHAFICHSVIFFLHENR